MLVAESTRTDAPPAPKFATRRIGHANLYVNNLDRSYKFYNEVCGFQGVGFEKSLSAGFLSNGNTHHDFGLVETDGRPRIGKDGKKQSVDNYHGYAGLNHIGWETVNKAKLIDSYKRSIEYGVDFKMKLFHGGSFSLYLYDPDGFLHEFYADVRRDWRTIFNGPVDIGLITSQWNPNTDKSYIEEQYWDPEPEWRHQENGLILPLRVARTVFHVSDIETMKLFYTIIGGFDICYEAPDKSYAYLRGEAKQSSYDIALIRNDNDVQNGYHHVACEIYNEDTLEKSVRRLRESGIVTYMEIDDARKRSFFLRDPDNLLLEFYVERAADYTVLADIDTNKRAFYA
jgi:catechol 2,3-dioxygenase